MHEKRDGEDKSIQDEVEQLRCRADHWEKYFNEMSNKMKLEVELFAKTRKSVVAQLNQLEACWNDAEIIIESINDERQRHNSELESKQQEVILQLTDDIAFLKEQIEDNEKQYQHDIQEIQKVNSNKIISLTASDEIQREQINQLRSELETREQVFDEYKQLSNQEINMMVGELQQLRRHSNIRQDQTMKREKKLKDQISTMQKKLWSSVAVKDCETTKAHYYKEVNKLHSELVKKSKILIFTKKKLRNEQLRLAQMLRMPLSEYTRSPSTLILQKEKQNKRLFDLKPIKLDIDNLKQMKTNNDIQAALSSLVEKLQQYVFDIEQTGIKQHYDHEYQDPNEDFNLGDSQELEDRLKTYQELQDNMNEYQQNNFRDQDYDSQEESESEQDQYA